MTRPQQALERIATNENFHGIAATSGHDAVTNVTGVSNKTPFPIHSVGKILSGVLMVEMVTQGVITESDLITPGIRLQPEIEEKLTRENPAVMERLSQVSILQAMQHTAGLASLNEKSGSKDCIDNYTKHLREGKETRHSMGDMVDFVGDKLTEVGPEKYSNDGLLLAGCALQNLYNSRTGQNLSYEEILNKLVIEPSKTNISMTRPVDVHYKAEDVEHLSKYPVTPAGGHFASTDDLLKLGEYLYQRCQDQEFMKGVKKYGAEFYDKDRNAIYHGGYMEGTTVEAKGSATEFAVSLNDGKTIAILMDRDASEDDRNSRRLSQTHARGFYKELRNSLEQENELHKPKIALITPGLSGDTDGSTIEQDAEKLKSLGFRVEFLPGSVSNSHPFVGAKIANTAEQRARQVINFAQDPEVVAMWAVNGGESCPEVAKLLVEYGKDPQKYLEKHQVDCVSGEILGYAAGAENGFSKDRLLPTIVGMSDVSSIQLSLAQFGFPSHYGSVSLANVEHLQRMSEAVQKGTASELEQIAQISRQDAPEKMSGTVYATVNGGLESSLHTDWQPKFPPNTVLMIEGVSGYDAIASTINKAKQAGALANVSAILVGNPVDPGEGINPESRERFAKFAVEFDLPIFSVGGNQFGHLAGKEPTPIANFGNIEIDTRLGTARIEQGSVRENILQFHAEKVAAPRVEFEAQQLGINPLALELTSINQHPIPTELTDVVGGKGRSLPMHLNLAGKTLLVDYSNWVELGRQMTDIANRGELEGVKAIIFSVDNHYPELKSRFDSATSEQEKVAVGLSFVTHPDFKFSHNSENTYRCDNATKERAEISFIPWLKSRGIELEAKDILVDGDGITLPIPIERNSEIIAQVTNEKSIGFVRQSAGRAEYFAKQHPEIPVFLTDRSNLPEVMRGPLFLAERLEVLQNKSEKEFEDIGSDSKKSWVDRISNSNQSRDDSVIKR